MKNTTKERIAVITFALVLAILGAALCFTGVRAIRDERWVVNHTVSHGATLGSVRSGFRERWTDVFEGADARRMGAALVSFGLLLGVWALGLTASGGKPLADKPGSFARLACVLFVVGFLLLVPPWRIAEGGAGAAFWCVVVVWSVAILTIIRSKLGKRAGSVVALLFIVTLVVAFVVPSRSMGGFILGFLACLGGFAHAMYVYPPWRKWAATSREADGDVPTTHHSGD
jgi:hypothetical protein